MQINFRVGDTVKVSEKIKEGQKSRTHIFEGVVIALKGKKENKNLTVRGIANGGIGVERIWSMNSPFISKIEVKKKGEIRKAKLYFLRKRIGKQALEVKEKKDVRKEEEKKEDVKDLP